jgi:hypothetical protein
VLPQTAPLECSAALPGQLARVEAELEALKRAVRQLVQREQDKHAHAAWIARMQRARRDIRLGLPISIVIGGAALAGLGTYGAVRFDSAVLPYFGAAVGVAVLAGGAGLLQNRVRQRRAISKELEAKRLRRLPHVEAAASRNAGVARVTWAF